MRVTKLVIGILMIVYSVWLFIQGLLGGFLGIISEKNMVAGIIGVLLCGLFMANGIVYVSTENSDGLGGDIAGLAMMIVPVPPELLILLLLVLGVLSPQKPAFPSILSA